MKLQENTAKWRKTKRGLITNLYGKMKKRMSVEFTLEYLHEFSNCTKFNRLFIEWEKSNYHKQLKPSIDRINHNDVYKMGNIQWLTWAENRFKQTMERRNRSAKVAQIINGKIIKVYKSQRDAVLKTGISQGNMSTVLTGKRLYAGGYSWKYLTGNIHNEK